MKSDLKTVALYIEVVTKARFAVLYKLSAVITFNFSSILKFLTLYMSAWKENILLLCLWDSCFKVSTCLQLGYQTVYTCVLDFDDNKFRSFIKGFLSMSEVIKTCVLCHGGHCTKKKHWQLITHCISPIIVYLDSIVYCVHCTLLYLHQH